MSKADPLSEVIDYWEKGNVANSPPFCWKSIVDILKTEHVDELGLSGRIKEKYCRGGKYFENT